MRDPSLGHPPRRRKLQNAASIAAGVMMVGAASAAEAQTGAAPNICGRFPIASVAAALGVELHRASELEDRLGDHVRSLCSLHADGGDAVDIVEWTRRDRRPPPPAPRDAAECDLTCVQVGREPNLYAYGQRQYPAATCVSREPRRDRDVNAGPLTACYNTRGPRRLVLIVQRPPGARPIAIETLKSAFDRLQPPR